MWSYARNRYRYFYESFRENFLQKVTTNIAGVFNCLENCKINFGKVNV
jgi:hypothetical protein